MINREFFNIYALPIIQNDLFKSSKQIYSHGSINIYDHSIAVAELAFSMAEKRQGIDMVCVIRAALLHDFFLYEWHVPGLRYVKHGWVHPAISAKNAEQVFNITESEAECIKTHMWPWTLFKLPKSREAWIITAADKIIAIKEIFFKRGRRHTLVDPVEEKQNVTAGL
jgi:uncharacterized protein